MLSRKIDHSSNKTYLNHSFDRFLAILLGHFTQWTYPGQSCPNQHTISIQIVSQVPQPNLDLHPNQTNGPDDQPPRPLRLDPKDMFHTTPDSGTRPIPLGLSIRQLLVLASLAHSLSFSSERYAESAHTSRLLLSSSKRPSKT